MKAHLKINTQFKQTLILSYDQLEGKVIPLTQLSFITRMMTQYRLLFSYRAFNAQKTLLRYRYAMGNVCVLPIIDYAICEHAKKVFEKDNIALSLYLTEDILWHVVQKDQQIKEDWQIFFVTSFDHGYSINAFYKGFLVFKRTLERNDDDVAMEKLETETFLPHEKIYDEVISSVRYLKRIAPLPLKAHFCMLSFSMEAQDIDKALFCYFVKQFQGKSAVNTQSINTLKLSWTTQYIQASEKEYLHQGLKEKPCARILLPWALWPVILFKKGIQFVKYVVLPFMIMTALVWAGVGGLNVFYDRDTLEKERIAYQKRASDFYVVEGLYNQKQQPFFEDFLKDMEKIMHSNKDLSLVGMERKHDHDSDGDKSLRRRDVRDKRQPFVNILFQEKLSPHFIQNIQKKYPKYLFHQEVQSPHANVLRVDIKR